MFTIHLIDLQFHSFHGLHEEERVLGNDYTVNVELTIDSKDKVSSLEQTVNYESVYTLIAERMKIPTKLLETVAQDLAKLIYAGDGRISSIAVNIQKKYPPMPTIQGHVGVTYKTSF